MCVGKGVPFERRLRAWLELSSSKTKTKDADLLPRGGLLARSISFVCLDNSDSNEDKYETKHTKKEDASSSFRKRVLLRMCLGKKRGGICETGSLEIPHARLTRCGLWSIPPNRYTDRSERAKGRLFRVGWKGKTMTR